MSVVDTVLRKNRQTLGSPVRRWRGGPSLYFDFRSGRVDPRLTFTRASTATYIDKNNVRQTAAVDQPRFEYDSGGNLLGLRMDEGRTNYLLNSGAPATQTVTLSVGIYCVWTIGGAVTVTAGTAVTAGLGSASGIDYPNVVFSVTTGGTVQVVPSSSPAAFQLENGSHPTSYIPTTGSAVTRAQDILSLGLNNSVPWYNPSGWSAVVDVMIPSLGIDAAAAARRLFGLSDGTTSNRVNIFLPGNTSTLRANTIVAGSSATIIAATNLTPGTPFKSGVVVDGVNLRASLVGGAVQSTAKGIPTLGTLGIGYLAGNPGQLGGYVRSLRFWRRVLTDAELLRATR